jgi:hypothetical protein
MNPANCPGDVKYTTEPADNKDWSVVTADPLAALAIRTDVYPFAVLVFGDADTVLKTAALLLLSLHWVTVVPLLTVIVFESAASIHKVHPGMVLGSKSHMFFDTGNRTDVIV